MSQTTHAFEVAFTEFTAKHLWRYMRFFLRSHLARRCRICILSEKYAKLDKDGICEYCTSYQKTNSINTSTSKNNPDLQLKLDNLIQTQIGKGTGAYDAVLLLSGGKDSAYMLHRITKEYPDLRVITLLVDNGFMSQYALANVDHIRSRFDVPHVTLHPKPSFANKAFHYALTHLELQKHYSIVDWMDADITFDHARNFAAANGIPLILCGLAAVQAELVFGNIIEGIEFSPALERMHRTTRAGIPIEDICEEANMAYWFDGSKWPAERVPRFVLPFTAWNPDEDVILREVDKLGLIDKKKSRPLMTNNALIPIIGMTEMARFGYCCWEVEFARMVREGKSDRTYWLAIFEMLEFSTRSGKFINNTVVATLARLSLSKKDLGIHL